MTGRICRTGTLPEDDEHALQAVQSQFGAIPTRDGTGHGIPDLGAEGRVHPEGGLDCDGRIFLIGNEIDFTVSPQGPMDEKQGS